MKIPSIIANKSVNLLSGLGNNDDCLAAMIAKDWIGDAATVYTYKKEGGKDDAREKAIEEFGTGAIWLFGIPAVKKLIDKTVYPLLKLDSNFDPRLLNDKNKLQQIIETVQNADNSALAKQKQVFTGLFDKNSVIKSLTNEKLYKGLAIGKFAVATIASAIGLSAIIKYKQKTTNDRIERDLKNQTPIKVSPEKLQGSVDKNRAFMALNDKNKKNNIAFKGGLAEFMYNPIKNTMLLDGVITSTRLAEARKGERSEVLFKEACQIAFIYGFPHLFEKITGSLGKKINCPIELDPKVLFDKDLKTKLDSSKDTIEQISKSTNILETLKNITIDNPVIDLLQKNGTISTINNKAGKVLAIDYFKPLDDKAVKNAVENLSSLKLNFGNLGKIKALKTTTILANVLAGAAIMGIIQPLANIYIRKAKNNGDNRNPAIVAQENKMKLATKA